MEVWANRDSPSKCPRSQQRTTWSYKKKFLRPLHQEINELNKTLKKWIQPYSIKREREKTIHWWHGKQWMMTWGDIHCLEPERGDFKRKTQKEVIKRPNKYAHVVSVVGTKSHDIHVWLMGGRASLANAHRPAEINMNVWLVYISWPEHIEDMFLGVMYVNHMLCFIFMFIFQWHAGTCSVSFCVPCVSLCLYDCLFMSICGAAILCSSQSLPKQWW